MPEVLFGHGISGTEAVRDVSLAVVIVVIGLISLLLAVDFSPELGSAPPDEGPTTVVYLDETLSLRSAGSA